MRIYPEERSFQLVSLLVSLSFHSDEKFSSLLDFQKPTRYFENSKNGE